MAFLSPKFRAVLPSTKFLILFFFCITLAGGIAFAALQGGSQASGEISAFASHENEAGDSDGDGFKDWEERVLGLDPNKADSDGDGTPDREEIVLGRNPKVMGADTLGTGTPSATTTPLTETQKLTNDIIFLGMAIDKAGPKSEKEVEQLGTRFSSLLVQRLESMEFENRWKVSDMRVVAPSPDLTSAMKSYGNSLGEIIPGMSPGGESELVIISTRPERALVEALDRYFLTGAVAAGESVESCP